MGFVPAPVLGVDGLGVVHHVRGDTGVLFNFLAGSKIVPARVFIASVHKKIHPTAIGYLAKVSPNEPSVLTACKSTW
ncbi:hypothetical protein CCHOA_06720 [Corynebacterium choanae]|uniref:Uncharacterized protein n=1 Tax=Corynebacterium choanae TaxID=1862358 RepID=A0A3G6J6Y8_9CORY|nr:hypothetical protein CCHOA_06720 [Corynebacterium choanae]